MLRIQTGVKISEEFPQGKAGEYIWFDGQPWPLDDNSAVISIEAFGDELKNVHIQALGEGTSQMALDGKTLLHREWLNTDARYVARQMSMFYPPVPRPARDDR